jgi:microcystin-dependent protein
LQCSPSRRFGAASAPTDWLLCDGSAVSRTSYSTLFGVIGTTYGSGDGSSTFNLPDLRGRAPIGYAASGGHTDVSTLGNNDGVALANRRAKHNHTNSLTLPNHVHSVSAYVVDFDFDSPNYNTGAPNAAGAHKDYGHTNDSSIISVSVGNPTSNPAVSGTIGPSGTNPNDAPAYLVLNYIIKT